MGTADSVGLKGCPKQLFVVNAVLVRAGSADSVCFLVTAGLKRTERLPEIVVVGLAAKQNVRRLVVQKMVLQDGTTETADLQRWWKLWL
jgi:hypothetical protein